MTTEAKSRAGEGVSALCSHLQADPRGAKVRLPRGEMACFTCYLAVVRGEMEPSELKRIRPSWMVYHRELRRQANGSY